MAVDVHNQHLVFTHRCFREVHVMGTRILGFTYSQTPFSGDCVPDERPCAFVGQSLFSHFAEHAPEVRRWLIHRQLHRWQAGPVGSLHATYGCQGQQGIEPRRGDLPKEALTRNDIALPQTLRANQMPGLGHRGHGKVLQDNALQQFNRHQNSPFAFGTLFSLSTTRGSSKSPTTIGNCTRRRSGNTAAGLANIFFQNRHGSAPLMRRSFSVKLGWVKRDPKNVFSHACTSHRFSVDGSSALPVQTLPRLQTLKNGAW